MELFAQAAAQQSIEQKALQVRLHDLEDRTASLEAQLAESLAGRAQDAAEYAQRLGTMEAHCEAELNGRRALARRVAELAREVAEDRCARADDHHRLLKFESKGAPPGFPSTEEDLVQKKAPKHKARSASPRGDVVQGTATDRELEVLLDELLVVIDANAGQVLASNFPKAYVACHGKQLDFRSLGYHRLTDLVRRLPGLHIEAGSRAYVRRAGLQEAAPLSLPFDDLPPLVAQSEPFATDAPPAPPAQARLGYVPDVTSGAPSWSSVAMSGAP
jgi:hypothetical protein